MRGTATRPSADMTDAGRQPTLEVVVRRHGDVVHRELVESEQEAALVAETWAELEGVHCEVRSISGPLPEDVSALEPETIGDDGPG